MAVTEAQRRAMKKYYDSHREQILMRIDRNRLKEYKKIYQSTTEYKERDALRKRRFRIFQKESERLRSILLN